MTELNLTYSPGANGCDPQWAHKISDGQQIVIQDARAYGGGLPVGIWDEVEGCLYHFDAGCTVPGAYEAAARVMALVEDCGGNVEAAHEAFHAK